MFLNKKKTKVRGPKNCSNGQPETKNQCIGGKASVEYQNSFKLWFESKNLGQQFNHSLSLNH